MTGHEDQLGEVVHHLIDQTHFLRPHRESWPRYPRASKDRHTQLNALRIDRIHQRIGYPDLRLVTGIERTESTHAVLFVLPHHGPNAVHATVRIHAAHSDEPVRMVL